MQRLLDLGKKIKTKLAQQLFRGQLDGIEDWIDTNWKSHLSVNEKKNLYQSASAVAYKAAEKQLHLKFLIKYLKLFDFEEESATTSDNEVVVDEAAQALIAAISSGLFCIA